MDNDKKNKPLVSVMDIILVLVTNGLWMIWIVIKILQANKNGEIPKRNDFYYDRSDDTRIEVKRASDVVKHKYTRENNESKFNGTRHFISSQDCNSHDSKHDKFEINEDEIRQGNIVGVIIFFVIAAVLIGAYMYFK